MLTNDELASIEQNPYKADFPLLVPPRSARLRFSTRNAASTRP